MPEVAYATSSDLDSVIDSGLRSELETTSGDIDAALLDASRMIDSWICGRYQTPVNTTDCPLSGPILRQKTVALAKYLIVDRKSNLAPSQHDTCKHLYDEAETWGQMVAKKAMSLPDAAPLPIPDPKILAAKAPNLYFAGDAPVFVEDDMGRL